ncbi:MAG TPA: helix-turn-helix domain-containing protein, partial [Acidimicrobiales bacterium]|nr:helix-turn-helix domain-containing protein [Acidimicrobiales bacterium]
MARSVGRSAGPLVREWRLRRGRSQMDLALETGVSPRHLSFVETGRSKPSPEVLLALAEALSVPLRERNALLLAAGYAPRYHERSLEDPAMARVRHSLRRLLDNHQPYPGAVIDRAWNVVLANPAATALVDMLPAEVVGPPTNVFRVCLHPEGLARHTLNFPEWAPYLLGHLQHLAVLSPDDEVTGLLEEVTGYPTVVALGDWRRARVPEQPALLVPWRLRRGGDELALFTTLTVF